MLCTIVEIYNTMQTKTKVSEFRKAQQSTDGLPPPMALSNMHQQIYDLIPAHFERIENEFDDDAPTFKTEHQQSQKLESNKTNDPNSPMDSMDTESTAVTSQKSSKMGPKLKKSQTEQSESSSNAIIDQKYLMDLRKCQMTVEHKLKMKLIQEEHDLKIGLYECKKAIIQQQNQINELKVVTLNEEIKASREKASHYRMLQMFQSSSEGRNTISAPPSTDECTICRFV
uniref:Uncharacterized protein n=1 Tax=Romanomermis culicivorax TaxID=13658 RepID=A0A915KJI4_ROMCU